MTVNDAVRVTLLQAAEIVDVAAVVTDVVVTVKVALDEPAGTVTLAGTLVAAELSLSDTTAPPLGAAPLKVTVPVDELPPVTLDGLTETVDNDADGGGGGAPSVTVIAPNTNVPFIAAESCGVVVPPGNVVMAKVALVAPPGTVTLNGTLAESGWLLARLIATPFGGAGPPSLTVPVAEAPPATLEGLTVSDVSGGRLGYSVNSFDRVTPPPVTEIVTAVGALTAAVAMSKKPTPLPAKTVTVSGTAASAGSLLSTCMISSWPAPSAAVTTPCEPLVVVDIGLTSNDVGAGPGVSVIFHVCVTPAALAVTLATVVVVTGLVWIENPVPLTPAGMVTVAGTDAAAESVERLTLNPAGPARPPPSRSTHPAMVAPPVARTCG